jgi:hypothetical protein
MSGSLCFQRIVVWGEPKSTARFHLAPINGAAVPETTAPAPVARAPVYRRLALRWSSQSPTKIRPERAGGIANGFPI